VLDDDEIYSDGGESEYRPDDDEAVQAKKDEAETQESGDEAPEPEAEPEPESEHDECEEFEKQVRADEKSLDALYANVNYAVVLAFLDKFGAHLQLKEFTFKNLECQLLNAKSISRKFFDFHLNLLKRLSFGKHVKKEKWEYYLKRVSMNNTLM
jgi:hypothetical protein